MPGANVTTRSRVWPTLWSGRAEIATAVTKARSAVEMGVERGREMAGAGTRGHSANCWEKRV